MTVLGSWAIGNIVVGASLQGSSEGTTKYFHRMNAGWNLVNLGLAGAGFLAYQKSKKTKFGFIPNYSGTTQNSEDFFIQHWLGCRVYARRFYT